MSKPTKIYLGDLAYFNRYTLSTLYTPLNIGYLAVYLNQKFGPDVSVSLFKDPQQLLQATMDDKPDMVGLSLFYWNSDLNRLVIEKIRQKYGNQVVIVVGGPSVDIDKAEQIKLFKKCPGIDALIPNEGELGLANLVENYRLNSIGLWDKQIAGISFFKDNQLIQGENIGLSMDLSNLGSPYLMGYMDNFIKGDFQPLIQTSRSCPYTCAFCVSGKNKGKLRDFPIEQVKEEITFLAKTYSDRSYFTLFIADENFGIFPRDSEIAAHIKKCTWQFRFPGRVFFYNDKRLTQTSRDVLENLGDLNSLGLSVALQSENPETLKAINRINLTEQDIDVAISWATSKGLTTSTELIFGLPFETLQSFVTLLEASVRRGFDSILCHNLFLMDGIEMNRAGYRTQYNLQTKYRLVGTNYGGIGNDFSAEVEEVVISTTHFSYQDFISVRCLNFLFYSVYTLGFYKPFFQLMRYLDISLLNFFMDFMNPDPNEEWPKEYIRFVSDFKNAVVAELFNSPEEAKEFARKLYIQNHNNVGEPARLNVFFGARLIYMEQEWVNQVIKKYLKTHSHLTASQNVTNLIDCILELCKRERIDPQNPSNLPEPMIVDYDLLSWRNYKYKSNILDMGMAPQTITFSIPKTVEQQILSYKDSIYSASKLEFFYNLMDFINRSDLIFRMAYQENPKAIIDSAAVGLGS
jgi:radical SAM superfamily enzyme YgiQ (UPF0313 family)